MTTSNSNSNGGGCLGCGGIILFFFVWALIFGVTVGGVHYGLSCSVDQGVTLEGFQ